MKKVCLYVTVSLFSVALPCLAKPTGKPRDVGPKEAIDTAEAYVKTNKVDVGRCRIESVMFQRRAGREFWVVTWGFRDSRLGECYSVIVYFDGEVAGIQGH